MNNLLRNYVEINFRLVATIDMLMGDRVGVICSHN